AAGHLYRAQRHRAPHRAGARPLGDAGRPRQRHPRHRCRLRRRMRLRHLPCLCRRGLAGEMRHGGRAGGEHAELRRDGRAQFPPLLPDHHVARARRPRRPHAGGATL
ncbi:MAG: Ferredoxin, 2Fe-2S, partial [uncultured Craurococcus sp.]